LRVVEDRGGGPGVITAAEYSSSSEEEGEEDKVVSVELPSSKGFFDRLYEREFIEEIGRMPFGKSGVSHHDCSSLLGGGNSFGRNSSGSTIEASLLSSFSPGSV